MTKFRSTASLVLVAVTATIALTACEGVRDHIRDKDFRDRSPAARTTGLPSPVANVVDMPGWTSDIDSAIAFATENAQTTILFVQRGGNANSEAMKKILTSGDVQVDSARKQYVTVNAETSPDIVARFGIQSTPAVVKIGPGGVPLAQKTGKPSKNDLIDFVR